MGEAAVARVLVAAWIPWEWETPAVLGADLGCSFLACPLLSAWLEAKGCAGSVRTPPPQRVPPMCCGHRVPWSPGRTASKFRCAPGWRIPRGAQRGGAGDASPLADPLRGLCSRRPNTVYNVTLGSGGVQVPVAAPEPRPTQEDGQLCCGHRVPASPDLTGNTAPRQPRPPAPSQPWGSESRRRRLSLAAAASQGGIFQHLAVGKENLEGVWKRMLFSCTAQAKKNEIKRLCGRCCSLKIVLL